jgi:EAL domain-containing protein (putative c-di-GMP-specific phosphodiesterase class I)
VVAALGELTLSAVPEEAAERIVRELSSRMDVDFVSVAQISSDGRMQELATYNAAAGVRRGGDAFAADLAQYLQSRARDGPWVDDTRAVRPVEPTEALKAADTDFVASAPLYSGDVMVGLLSIAVSRQEDRPPSVQQARLLASAIDYASVLEAVAGPAIAGRRDVVATRARLERIISEREFRIAMQPVVDLESEGIVGFEALARFDDGMPPLPRFAEATSVGLGADLELAAIREAVATASNLPAGAFLAVNVAPRTVVDRAVELGEIVAPAGRTVVLELTEHVPIHDYARLRAAIAEVGHPVDVAVDDAGAGYASLRHILELQPAFAKLDISLVRGIDGDELRQALAAGLNYFALRTGCRLIAEGVETPEESAMLFSLGIELAQGFLFGWPEFVSAA